MESSVTKSFSKKDMGKILYRGKILTREEIINELTKFGRLRELQGSQFDWELEDNIGDKPKRWTREEVRELEDMILDKIERESL